MKKKKEIQKRRSGFDLFSLLDSSLLLLLLLFLLLISKVSGIHINGVVKIGCPFLFVMLVLSLPCLGRFQESPASQVEILPQPFSLLFRGLE